MNPDGAAAGPRFAVPDDLDARLIASRDQSATVVRLAGATMGTTWEVRLALPAGENATALHTAIQQRLDGLVAEMSHWSPSSTLSRYNNSRAGSWTVLPPDFAAVMTAGLEIAARSGGAFDSAIGRLTDLWGLGPRRREAPLAEAVAVAKTASGWHRPTLSGRWLRQPGGTWLDLSGIAKGYAADAIADLLGAAGHRHALVEIGGECVGRGVRPDGDPWWVELETPPGLGLSPLRIALHQLAVATSGSYLRGAHTLDPRTGLLVAEAPLAVSVLHPSCMVADAWTTALTVLQVGSARALVETLDLPVRILGDDRSEWLSPALTRMVAAG